MGSRRWRAGTGGGESGPLYRETHGPGRVWWPGHARDPLLSACCADLTPQPALWGRALHLLGLTVVGGKGLPWKSRTPLLFSSRWPVPPVVIPSCAGVWEVFPAGQWPNMGVGLMRGSWHH